jgi:DNA processing protein
MLKNEDGAFDVVYNTTTITFRDLLGRYLNDVEEKYAPKILFVAGSMKLPVPGPRVSIVGTRKPSKQGIQAASRIAKELVEKGIIVVSGLARGIDTVAHRTAIENGGQTIAVLGTPLNRFYPPENIELQKLIMQKHLAISQFPIKHVTQRKDFVLRNRTMALVSDATIIVEAGETSGSLSQGWETLRLGRPLYVWKSTFDDPVLNWPQKMQRYGARRLDGLDELIDELPPPGMEYTVEL